MRYNRVLCLFAIRDIGEGEEITWDYSTTMFDDDWELKCNCGSSKCRGVVREFKYLQESLRNEYIKVGIVPGYLIGR